MTINDYRPASLITRVEQAIAFGRSLDWMLQHLGADPSIVDAALRRMDAAVRDDETAFTTSAADETNDLDHVLVTAYTSGALKVRPRGAQPNPERDEAVRLLAAGGMSDKDIAERIGMTGTAVCAVRKRRGIPCGVQRTGTTGQPTWNSLIRSREHHKRRARAA